MGSEKFCLRWNDFETNISSAFRELRDDKDFFDVTLACDDEQIQAHKVILSACSVFFRNILRRNPHQHPLLYMKGVKYTDLQSVLNFMYHGEVNVAQEELNSFLAVAEDLRVKGLTQNNSNSKSNHTDQTRHPRSRSPTKDQEPPAPLKHPRPAPPVRQPVPTAEDDDIQEVVPIKSEPRDPPMLPRPHGPAPIPVPVVQPQPQVYSSVHQPVALNTTEEQSVVTYQEETGYEEYGDYQYGEEDSSMAGQEKGPLTPEDLNQYVVNDQFSKEYHCGLCNTFKAPRPSKVKNHLEAIHFPGLFIYSCDVCNKTLAGRNALNIHKSTVHSRKTKF